MASLQSPANERRSTRKHQTSYIGSVVSTQPTARYNPEQSVLSAGGKTDGGMFHTSMMSEEQSQMIGRKPLSPFKLPPKEIVVPDPNDRVVHQRLYEYLRSEKERRDSAKMAASKENESNIKIE